MGKKHLIAAEAEGDQRSLWGEASHALSSELLYMKFLQGIPIAGIIGGMYDAVYLKRIADYADMKYKRRFLEKSNPDI